MFHGKQRPREGFTGNIAADIAVLGRLLDGLALPTSLISVLLAHAGSVARSADRLGLVSAGDVTHIVGRHTADSLLFASVRRPGLGERWLDVGSGAGFPGLVLSMCYPDVQFTLLEPQKRRAGFLELQVAELGLVNVDIRARRLEEVEEAFFDAAVARALTEPGRALRSMVRVLRPGGLAIVAVGAAEPDPEDDVIRTVSVGHFGDVDSPGRFFMMARGA